MSNEFLNVNKIYVKVEMAVSFKKYLQLYIVVFFSSLKIHYTDLHLPPVMDSVLPFHCTPF